MTAHEGDGGVEFGVRKVLDAETCPRPEHAGGFPGAPGEQSRREPRSHLLICSVSLARTHSEECLSLGPRAFPASGRVLRVCPWLAPPVSGALRGQEVPGHVAP